MPAARKEQEKAVSGASLIINEAIEDLDMETLQKWDKVTLEAFTSVAIGRTIIELS